MTAQITSTTQLATAKMPEPIPFYDLAAINLTSALEEALDEYIPALYYATGTLAEDVIASVMQNIQDALEEAVLHDYRTNQ